MKQIICHYPQGESNSGGTPDNTSLRRDEQQAVRKEAGNPGSIADVSGMSGDLDGGAGPGPGTEAQLNQGDRGPSPDKLDIRE
jgi:hypothetical protein